MSSVDKSVKQEDTFYSAYLKDPGLSSANAYPDSPTSAPSTPKAMSRFRTAPREIETLPSRAIVSQDNRPSDQGKLSKLRESATEPLTNKFDIIPLDDSSEQILNNYNLQMRVREFTRSLQQYDMNDVFTILQFSDDSSSTTLPETFNLL